MATLTVVTRAEGRMVGWGGLYNDSFQPGWGLEVGYFFHPAVWGFGYATELMGACTDVAYHALELREVRAFARPENVRSRRALEKAGFGAVKFVPKMKRLLYRRGRLGASAVSRALSPRRIEANIGKVLGLWQCRVCLCG